MTILYYDPTERDTDFFKQLSTIKDIEFEGKKLPVDYVIDGTRGIVTIERKTTPDFASSIMDGRLFSQISNTINAFPDGQHVYLIYGSWKLASKYSRFNMMGAYSALSSLLVDWKVNTVVFSKEEDAVFFLSSLVKRIGKPKGESSIQISKPKAKTVREQAIYFLASLPHIGYQKSKLMLGTGTPINVLTMIDSGMVVNGISPKISKDIKDVLDYREK